MNPTPVNENFYHVAQGSITPKDGALLADAADTYDIGSSANKFDTLYCDTINKSGGFLWDFVGQTNVLSATAQISFTGLNGDLDTEYMIISFLVGDTTSTLDLFLNGDTTASYGKQTIVIENNVTTEQRTTDSGIELNTVGTATTTADEISLCKTIVYAKTGNERPAVVSSGNSAQGDYVLNNDKKYYVWKDTSSTITSLVFEGSVNVGVGSYIGVWKRGQ